MIDYKLRVPVLVRAQEDCMMCMQETSRQKKCIIWFKYLIGNDGRNILLLDKQLKIFPPYQSDTALSYIIEMTSSCKGTP